MLNNLLYTILGNSPVLVRGAKLALFVGVAAAAAFLSTYIKEAQGVPETTAAIAVIVLGALEKAAKKEAA